MMTACKPALLASAALLLLVSPVLAAETKPGSFADFDARARAGKN